MKEVEIADKLMDKLSEIDKAKGKNFAPLFAMLTGLEVLATGHVAFTLAAFTGALEVAGVLTEEEMNNILG